MAVTTLKSQIRGDYSMNLKLRLSSSRKTQNFLSDVIPQTLVCGHVL
jgi:hypothetical protein